MSYFNHCIVDKKPKLVKRHPKHSTGVIIRFYVIILSYFTEEKYRFIVFQVYLQWPKKHFIKYFEVIQKISGPNFFHYYGTGDEGTNEFRYGIEEKQGHYKHLPTSMTSFWYLYC